MKKGKVTHSVLNAASDSDAPTYPTFWKKQAVCIFFSLNQKVWIIRYILKPVKLAWLFQVGYTAVSELWYWNKSMYFSLKGSLT